MGVPSYMNPLNYIKPTHLRLLLFLALLVIANVPYVGTSVRVEGSCMTKQCNGAPDCEETPQCYHNIQAKPHWIFWWPYPEFTMEFSEAEFGANAIPGLVIYANQEQLLHPEALAATMGYWYFVVLIITIPTAKDEEEKERSSI